jgi:hypothetical protein
MEAAGWTGSLAAASRPGSESFLGFGLSLCVPKLFPPGSQKCSPSSQCVPPTHSIRGNFIKFPPEKYMISTYTKDFP